MAISISHELVDPEWRVNSLKYQAIDKSMKGKQVNIPVPS